MLGRGFIAGLVSVSVVVGSGFSSDSAALVQGVRVTATVVDENGKPVRACLDTTNTSEPVLVSDAQGRIDGVISSREHPDYPLVVSDCSGEFPSLSSPYVPDIPAASVAAGFHDAGTVELFAFPSPIGFDYPDPGWYQCDSDPTQGHRVQVVYAHLDTHASRLETFRPMIELEARRASWEMRRSAERFGAYRDIRFLTDGSTDECSLDIETVELSSDIVRDETGESPFRAQTAWWAALGSFSFDPSTRVVYAILDSPYARAAAFKRPDDRPGEDNLSNTSGSAWMGVNSLRASGARTTMTHELIHSFGGIQESAPRYSGHCWTQYDPMCYRSPNDYWPPEAAEIVCPEVTGYLLDCHGDTYFNPKPAPGSYLATHWNTADSFFLYPNEPSADYVSPFDEPVLAGLGGIEHSASAFEKAVRVGL